MTATRKTRNKAAAAEVVTNLYAARSHAAWRRQFHKSHPAEKRMPRMRQRGGVMVDINLPWAKLHPKAQQDNLRAARAAYDAVMRFPDDREAAAEYIHKRWIARNKGDKSQPRQLFKPYAQLPEAEKDKDRAHVDQMKRALAALPRRRRKGAAPGPGRTLAFSAQDWRKIEAARKRLSAALGHDMPAQALLVAGAEALSALAGALPAKAKSRRA